VSFEFLRNLIDAWIWLICSFLARRFVIHYSFAWLLKVLMLFWLPSVIFLHKLLSDCFKVRLPDRSHNALHAVAKLAKFK
jgi:hypothetical protein